MSAKSPEIGVSRGLFFALPEGSPVGLLVRHSRALRDDMYLLIKGGPSRVVVGRLFSALTTPGFGDVPAVPYDKDG